jgi:ATP-dependent Lon protease
MSDSLPTEIPVMTLPNTVLFPHTILPLFIFEQRYREMLADVLAGSRVFAVAGLARGGGPETAAGEPPHAIATAGVIRACQKNANGTANLLLEGLVRIQILGIVRETPYRLIRVRPVPDRTEASAQALQRLRFQLLKAVEAMLQLGTSLPPELEHAIHGIEDPAALCDLLVFSMVHDPVFQQRMLETTDTARRLRKAIARLRFDGDEMRLHRRLQGKLGENEIGHN